MVRTIITLLVIVIALAAVAWGATELFSRGNEPSGADPIELAKHLTEIGAKMYGASWCSACNYQKDLFGDAWQYVDYVECSSSSGGQAAACQTANIEAYPTWVFPQGSTNMGAMSLEELADLSGFQPLIEPLS